MFTEVEGVWGDPKSKYQRKTSFLKRSRLDLCNKKDLKTFHQKLLKLSKLEKKTMNFSPKNPDPPEQLSERRLNNNSEIPKVINFFKSSPR